MLHLNAFHCNSMHFQFETDIDALKTDFGKTDWGKEKDEKKEDSGQRKIPTKI